MCLCVSDYTICHNPSNDKYMMYNINYYSLSLSTSPPLHDTRAEQITGYMITLAHIITGLQFTQQLWCYSISERDREKDTHTEKRQRDRQTDWWRVHDQKRQQKRERGLVKIHRQQQQCTHTHTHKHSLTHTLYVMHYALSHWVQTHTINNYTITTD